MTGRQSALKLGKIEEARSLGGLSPIGPPLVRPWVCAVVSRSIARCRASVDGLPGLASWNAAGRPTGGRQHSPSKKVTWLQGKGDVFPALNVRA